MEDTDSCKSFPCEEVSIKYEHSWLHRHCRSNLIHHERARGSGRLFSSLMAMNVIFLGAALISSVTLSSLHTQTYVIFMSILMLCSCGWICYYLLRTRKKPFATGIKDHHAAALRLRVSLALFGTCSLLVAVFKIGYDALLLSCEPAVDIFFSVMEIIFIITQTSLLWLSCGDCVQVQHNITRFGIMLTLATNFLLWLLAVINDSVHRELESLQLNNTEDKSRECLCPQHSICLAFQKGYVTLYPFNLEYSLISASMLFIMWRNVGRNEVSHFAFPQPTLRLQGVLYGPILGVATLLVGICVFILYQIQASTGTAVPATFIMYYVYSVVLLSVMVITCIIGVIAQTFREKHLADHSEINSENGENHSEIGRASKQKFTKHYKPRQEETSKDYEQQTSNTEEQKGVRAEYNNNWIDQEDNGAHRRCPQKNSDKCTGPAEIEKHNESSPRGEFVKEDIKDIMDTSHDYSTSKRKFTEEKGDHRDFKTSPGKRPPKNHTRSLEIILLLTAALGQFSICYYSIVALVAKSVWNLLNSLNLSHSILMILQHISQSIFIVEGMRKEHQEQIQQKLHQESKDESPRRMSMLEIRRASLAYLQNVGKLNVSRRLVKEIALFLVLCNIMSWIMSAFGAHPQYTNGVERDFYGSSAWFSILNFGLPLSVFYRMHSVGGLLDVYLTA